jgi:hypothetical protein
LSYVVRGIGITGVGARDVVELRERFFGLTKIQMKETLDVESAEVSRLRIEGTRCELHRDPIVAGLLSVEGRDGEVDEKVRVARVGINKLLEHLTCGLVLEPPHERDATVVLLDDLIVHWCGPTGY